MSSSLKYFQIMSFFGVILLGLLSLFALNESEFLKLEKGTNKWSALALFFASLFYLVVFVVCTIYIKTTNGKSVNEMINKKVYAYGITQDEVREDKTHLLNKENNVIN